MPSDTYDVTRRPKSDLTAHRKPDGGYDLIAEGYVMPAEVGGGGVPKLDFSVANNSMYLPSVM